jgi:hypothetical protein
MAEVKHIHIQNGDLLLLCDDPKCVEYRGGRTGVLIWNDETGDTVKLLHQDGCHGRGDVLLGRG